jgi:hypothetical protein
MVLCIKSGWENIKDQMNKVIQKDLEKFLWCFTKIVLDMPSDILYKQNKHFFFMPTIG